jgi:hypothetical protein
MTRKKGLHKALFPAVVPVLFMLFFGGLLNLSSPASGFAHHPESLIPKASLVLSDKPDFETNSQPLSYPCILKEDHRGFADRGPEPDMLAFSGVYIGYIVSVKSFVCSVPFSVISSWARNALKIRPPPTL